MQHLLTPELKADEAFAHFAALCWENDAAGLARVAEAVMRHHIRVHGAAPVAKDEAWARRAARAGI